jgi:hypothetical protein
MKDVGNLEKDDAYDESLNEIFGVEGFVVHPAPSRQFLDPLEIEIVAHGGHLFEVYFA